MKTSILQFLKTSGEQLDAQIAQALRIPMATVTQHVSQLCAAGEVICCQVTRYLDGAKIEGTSCRLSCNMPPPARGRKPGAKKDTGPDMHAA
jgi:predicted transcriptional regulator